MVQLSSKIPKKCMHSERCHPEDFPSLSLFIFLLLNIAIEVYSHFLKKTTNYWLSYHDYCIKMACIRFSFLILGLEYSDVHATFKDM